MVNKKTQLMVMSALMAALCFVATKIIQVPTPTSGYIHLGDGFVVLSGIILGPVYGGLAAGIGSMLTDLLSGYAQYAIATFFIKALVAVCAGFICRKALPVKNGRVIGAVIAGIVGMIIVVLGYWSFEGYVLGLGAIPAAAGIFTNVLQGIVGTITAALLVPVFDRIGIIKELRFGDSREKTK